LIAAHRVPEIKWKKTNHHMLKISKRGQFCKHQTITNTQKSQTITNAHNQELSQIRTHKITKLQSQTIIPPSAWRTWTKISIWERGSSVVIIAASKVCLIIREISVERLLTVHSSQKGTWDYVSLSWVWLKRKRMNWSRSCTDLLSIFSSVLLYWKGPLNTHNWQWLDREGLWIWQWPSQHITWQKQARKRQNLNDKSVSVLLVDQKQLLRLLCFLVQSRTSHQL
jgi:hypothetical protein